MSNEDVFGRNLPREADDERWYQLSKMAEMGLSVASIVHELRQPLAALKMALQIMRGQEGDVREYLTDALEQAGRLELLLMRVNDFLRPGRNRLEAVRPRELIEEALALHRGVLNNKQIQIASELEADLPELSVDKDKVLQLFFNLLCNARDAVLEKGRGRVMVWAARMGASGVEVLIGDDGPGVDPAVRQKIFEPFFSTKTKEQGTGLGLFIARRIAEEHGAVLELLDDDGRRTRGLGAMSTVFRVAFPGQRTRSSRPSDAPPAEPRGRALVVDDERVILKMLVKVLEKDGFDCDTAESGEEAVERLERQGFELLLLDKNLPGLSGVEVARRARSLYPSLTIVMVTGYPSEESAKEVASLGADDYVLKPIDIARLRARVRELVDDKRISMSGLAGAVPRKAEARSPRPSRAPRASSPGPSTIPPGAMLEMERYEEIIVLLVEDDPAVRRELEDILGELGCKVAAHATAEAAAAELSSLGADILVARPDVLRAHKDWFVPRLGVRRLLGSVAIMESAGVDKAIEAIHLGARGTFVVPPIKDKVVFEFERAVSRLLADHKPGG